MFTITTGGNGGPFIVQPGASANLIAGESIHMLAGTHLQAGSQVHAYIAPNGPFCDDPDKQLLATKTDTEGKALRSEVANIREGSQFEAEAGAETESIFKVYPNPTPGQFTLQMVGYPNNKKIRVEVLGLRGERILSEELSGDMVQHQISLEGQVPGIYIVRVTRGQQTGVKRIIKR